MPGKYLSGFFSSSQENILFFVFSSILLLSIFLGIATEMYFLAGIPAFLLLIFVTLVDFRKTFFLLLISIPLSTEVYLPGGLGTDLPTEPLMIGLMGVGILYSITHWKSIDARFLKHPITILLLLHLGWTFIAVIYSHSFIISLKFILAKIWYVAVFYFMAGKILASQKDFNTLFWCIFIPLMLTIGYVWIGHSAHGFSFDSIKSVLHPFYRNHVAYAALLTVFSPFLWYILGKQKRWSKKWWLLSTGAVLLLIAIQLSYTRAAYIGLVLAFLTYFIVRLRLIKIALGASIVGGVILLSFLSYNNKYLDYAPNYEKTIAHKDFDNLVEATYKMEDISTMERLYRWVAGVRMGATEPLTGFGPGNFYTFYKSYTVNSFKTYVSDNPEKSGIHSYYLMIFVEQGYIGIFFFLLLCFFTFIKGEAIYHQTKDASRKRMVMTVVLVLLIIDSLNLINDLIETDKVGSFFFLSMAVLVNLDLKNKEPSHQHI